MKNIDVCPGTLASGFKSYSPLCLRKVFDGKKVSPYLDFSLEETSNEILASIKSISISGVQEKFSALIKQGKITLTAPGESGRYIIKPIPNYTHLRFRQNIPARGSVFLYAIISLRFIIKKRRPCDPATAKARVTII